MSDAIWVSIVTGGFGLLSMLLAVLLKRYTALLDARAEDRDSFCLAAYNRLFEMAFASHNALHQYVQFQELHPTNQQGAEVLWFEIINAPAPKHEINEAKARRRSFSGGGESE